MMNSELRRYTNNSFLAKNLMKSLILSRKNTKILKPKEILKMVMLKRRRQCIGCSRLDESIRPGPTDLATGGTDLPQCTVCRGSSFEGGRGGTPNEEGGRSIANLIGLRSRPFGRLSNQKRRRWRSFRRQTNRNAAPRMAWEELGERRFLGSSEWKIQIPTRIQTTPLNHTKGAEPKIDITPLSE